MDVSPVRTELSRLCLPISDPGAPLLLDRPLPMPAGCCALDQRAPLCSGARGTSSSGTVVPDVQRVAGSGQLSTAHQCSLGHGSASASPESLLCATGRKEPSVQITLHKNTNRALDSADLNAYYPGDTVCGTLLLSLPRPTPVRLVRVSLSGGLSADARENSISPLKKQVFYQRQTLFGTDAGCIHQLRKEGQVSFGGQNEPARQAAQDFLSSVQSDGDECANIGCCDIMPMYRDDPVGDKFGAILGKAALEPPINLEYFSLDHTDENQLTEALFESSTISSDYFRCASPSNSECAASLPSESGPSMGTTDRSQDGSVPDVVFPPGLHCFRFHLAFPNDHSLPRSFEHFAASCRYHIRARVRIPAQTGAILLESRTSIRFLGSLDASDPRYTHRVDATGRRTVGHFAWKTGYLEAKAFVERTAFAPDEDVRITLNVKNCSDSPYHVVVKLWQTIVCRDGSSTKRASWAPAASHPGASSSACSSPFLRPRSTPPAEEGRSAIEGGEALPSYHGSCGAALTPRNPPSTGASSIPTPVCRISLPGEVTARVLDCSVSVPVPRKLPPTLADSLIETSYALVVNIKPILHHTKCLKLAIPIIIADFANSPSPPYMPEPRDGEITIASTPRCSDGDDRQGKLT